MLEIFQQTLFFKQQAKANLQSRAASAQKALAKSSDELRDNEDHPTREAPQQKVPPEFSLLKGALDQLIKKKLIRIVATSEKPSDGAYDLFTLYNSEYAVEKLGSATIDGNVYIEQVDRLCTDLSKGLSNLNVANHLQLLYYCTPYESTADLQIDYGIYAIQVSTTHLDLTRLL